MSDQDSFISEVNDAVRQDELYGYLRKYGWIAALVVLGLVGGAAWNEYNKAQKTASAQAIGDSLLDAISEDDVAARAQALSALDVDGPAVAVSSLMSAAALVEAGETAEAMTILDALSTNADADQIYRDIAVFKSALLDEGESRTSKLDALAQPGGSLRLMAQEQLTLDLIAAGQVDDAITSLRGIIEDAEVTQGLRDRAQTLIVALGAPLEVDAENQDGQ